MLKNTLKYYKKSICLLFPLLTGILTKVSGTYIDCSVH